jgi:xanthine dehydrogenase small subunit
MAVRQTIKFLLNDKWCEVGGIDPTMTLLDWLRLERRLTGAKEGCAEGDCGACTVLVGQLRQGALRYEAINACIRFVATLDACHVVTVEYLAQSHGNLHPVQQAMVELHGSQCGFCTPGIVMSLVGLWLEDDAKPAPQRVEEALAGNLCRCTGYGPIVAALARAHEIAKPSQDAIRHARETVAASLAALTDDAVIEIGAAGRRFLAPATEDQLADLYAANPEAVLVAGATDVGLWITKEMLRPQTVIYLGRIASLNRVTDTGEALEFGATASLTEARNALPALHPDLDELMRRFASEQIRNAGTVGGNIANGSPIGDLPPAFIAMGAEVVLRHGAGRRRLPLERLYLAYKKQDRRPGEFVEAVVLPKIPAGVKFHVSKISKRLEEDITAVLGVFYLATDSAGVVTEARLAYGGMAATPKRAAAAEAALVGKVWSEASADAAAKATAQDFQPLDDWRATARYRSTVAANIVRRFYAETASPVQAARVSSHLRSAAHV